MRVEWQSQSETAGAGVWMMVWGGGGHHPSSLGAGRLVCGRSVACVSGSGEAPGGLDTLQKQKLRMIMPGMMDSVAMLMSPNWKPVRNWV